jgi:hypothetical protein
MQRSFQEVHKPLKSAGGNFERLDFQPQQERAMNIFESIVSKIFHPNLAGAAPLSPMANPAAAPNLTPSQTSASAQPADVDSILKGLASKNSQKLNWQTSIVDLLKLLDLDSSLAARKQLAQELNFKGDTNDSAAMNIWLQDQVMKKLAENGGKVPESLKH